MVIKAFYIRVLSGVVGNKDKHKRSDADLQAITRLKDLIRHAESKSGLELVDSVRCVFETLDKQRYLVGRWFFSGSALYEGLKCLVEDPTFEPMEVARIEAEELDGMAADALKEEPSEDKILHHKAMRDIYKKTEVRKVKLRDKHDKLEVTHNQNVQFLKNPLGYFKSTELRIEDEERKLAQLKFKLDDLGVEEEIYSNHTTKNLGVF